MDTNSTKDRADTLQRIRHEIDARPPASWEPPNFREGLKALLNAAKDAKRQPDAETVFERKIEGMEFWIDADGGGGMIMQADDEGRQTLFDITPSEMHAIMNFWRPLLIALLIAEFRPASGEADDEA